MKNKKIAAIGSQVVFKDISLIESAYRDCIL
jgi:hypothetical protein